MSGECRLETFDAPAGGLLTTFTTGELTALCPFDFGGPDFYDLTIQYTTDQLVLESRSLKQYVESWRSEEISAEGLADAIHSDVVEAVAPNECYVRVEQARRGGIAETVEVGDRDLHA